MKGITCAVITVLVALPAGVSFGYLLSPGYRMAPEGFINLAGTWHYLDFGKGTIEQDGNKVTIYLTWLPPDADPPSYPGYRITAILEGTRLEGEWVMLPGGEGPYRFQADVSPDRERISVHDTEDPFGAGFNGSVYIRDEPESERPELETAATKEKASLSGVWHYKAWGRGTVEQNGRKVTIYLTWLPPGAEPKCYPEYRISAELEGSSLDGEWMYLPTREGPFRFHAKVTGDGNRIEVDDTEDPLSAGFNGSVYIRGPAPKAGPFHRSVLEDMGRPPYPIVETGAHQLPPR